jgi:hypothetical protein
VDLGDQGELVLGGDQLGGLEGGQQLDDVDAHELDLLDAQPRLDLAHRGVELVLGAAGLLDPDDQPLVRGDGAGGDGRPGAVVGVDQDARGGRGHVPHHVELRLDDLLISRRAVLALSFSALCAMSIIELFWSKATIVSVPLGC